MTVEMLAEKLYAAHCARSEWKDTKTGAKLASWSDLTRVEKDSWIAAAQASIDLHEVGQTDPKPLMTSTHQETREKTSADDVRMKELDKEAREHVRAMAYAEQPNAPKQVKPGEHPPVKTQEPTHVSVPPAPGNPSAAPKQTPPDPIRP